jgi:hypothetical protein
LCSWTQIVRGDSSVQRRARANQRPERQDDGYDMGITDGRLFDGAGNLNESAGTGFLVGAGRGVRTWGRLWRRHLEFFSIPAPIVTHFWGRPTFLLLEHAVVVFQ